VIRKLLLALLAIGLFCAAALADGAPPPVRQPTDLAASQAKNLDLKAIDDALIKANRSWAGYGPDISMKDFFAVYKGGADTKFSPKTLLYGCLRYILREVLANTGLLAQLIVLAVVAAVLQNVQSAFESEATGKVAHMVVYLVLVSLAVTGFGMAAATARAVVDSLSGFMLAMLPTMLTLLAGMGGVTSAAIFHPLMITFTSTAATVMTTIVFPLIFLSAVLEIVSGLNDQYKLTNLAGLLRQGALYTLGLTSTHFLGVVAFKGVAGAVADGVTMKTAKFLFGSFIPVVGKTFVDATELIFGSSLLFKNALGMAGAATIFFLTIFPLLKILSLCLIYQLAGALVQPMGANQMAKMLATMAKSLQLLFASVALVALMFLVGITVMVGSANLTVMVRR
jgi:stage III sporulation protein AE